MRDFLPLLVLVCAVGTASDAGATAMFDARAIGVLTLLGIDGGDVSVIAKDSSHFTFTDMDGLSAATATGSAPPSVDTTLLVDESIAGAALSFGLSGIGFAEALVQNSSSVHVTNESSTENAVVRFGIDYSLLTTSTVTSPFELAEAFATVFVGSISDTYLDVAVPTGLGLVSMADRLEFSVAVGAMESTKLSFLVDSNGSAHGFPIARAAPIPSSLSLLSLGLIALFGRRLHR